MWKTHYKIQTKICESRLLSTSLGLQCQGLQVAFHATFCKMYQHVLTFVFTFYYKSKSIFLFQKFGKNNELFSKTRFLCVGKYMFVMRICDMSVSNNSGTSWIVCRSILIAFFPWKFPHRVREYKNIRRG